MVDGSVDFRHALAERFAIFQRDRTRYVVASSINTCRHFPEKDPTLFAGQPPPRFPRRLCLDQRLADGRSIDRSDLRKDFTCRRVDHIDRVLCSRPTVGKVQSARIHLFSPISSTVARDSVLGSML